MQGCMIHPSLCSLHAFALAAEGGFVLSTWREGSRHPRLLFQHKRGGNESTPHFLYPSKGTPQHVAPKFCTMGRIHTRPQPDQHVPDGRHAIGSVRGGGKGRGRGRGGVCLWRGRISAVESSQCTHPFRVSRAFYGVEDIVVLDGLLHLTGDSR